jgi:hypothetical protein
LETGKASILDTRRMRKDVRWKSLRFILPCRKLRFHERPRMSANGGIDGFFAAARNKMSLLKKTLRDVAEVPRYQPSTR